MLLSILSSWHLGAWGDLSTRVLLAACIALGIVLLATPIWIRYFQRMQLGQVVRTDGPETHAVKKGTPTMGGVLLLVSVCLSVLLCGDLSSHYIKAALLTWLGFGALGWLDDYLKVMRQNSRGVSASMKMLVQSLLALGVLLYLYRQAGPLETRLMIPWVTHTLVSFGIGYVVLGYFVVVGGSNAVNLTDGLDGLALFPVMCVVAALGLLAYWAGSPLSAAALHLVFVPGASALAVMAAAVFAACLGLLWYNAYPAQIFMGDVGSLSLGALLGIMAVMVRQEILFFLMGGIFVIETLSVMIQVISYRTRGRRVFKMAPIHHHFELKGWSESTVTVRFWLVTLVLVGIALWSVWIRQ
jgi:phospho-N-acetylmuramoyl-pentapeptide-transferase